MQWDRREAFWQPFCFAKVLQNQDSEHPNQVKVQLALLYEEKYHETWAYLGEPYGSEQYGITFVPEVGEQVLVALPFGELPVVMTSIRGAKKPPEESDGNKDNLIKTIHTKGGNILKFQDKQDNAEITIQTAGGNYIKIEDKNPKISVTDKDGKNCIIIDAKSNKIEIQADDSVTVVGKKSISLKVGSKEVLKADQNSLTLKSTKITIQADQALEAKGAQLNLSGQTAKINASGQMEVSSSGVTQVKGSLLKLNG